MTGIRIPGTTCPDCGAILLIGTTPSVAEAAEKVLLHTCPEVTP